MGLFDIIKRTFANNLRSCAQQASARPACASPAETTLGSRPKINSRWTAVANVWHTVYSLSHFRKRALLIGIAYGNRKEWTLRGTHSDVDSVQRLLSGRYAFRSEDIVIMKDAEGVEQHLWPTEKNIRRELKNFTLNCGPRDRFFFLYAGHAGQKTERIKGSERDGKDEFIIPCDVLDMDGKGCIEDNDLHDYLVKPLKPHCKLVAVLDACHSATLLDLTHDKCLDVGRWTSKVVHTVHRVLDVLDIPSLEPSPKVEQQPNEAVQSVCCDVMMPVMNRLVRRWRFCCGLCRPAIPWDEPFVLCISSCKDNESAIETSGVSMTKTLVGVLEAHERPSLAELLTHVRANLASAYEDEKRKRWEQWKAKNAKNPDVGKVLRLTPLACLNLVPNQLPRRLSQRIPCYPPLAKVQMASNLPRQTAVERLWL
ncbi:uncharacterized protein SCHCODRAFT_02625539 [Schizophyllum commune H4-8]|uniref:uncharacterized protein n=1 Tax=Schizophyllum commune (strain H4-8 / FGSC 9210) TaxID=578458 RepID=UPI00216030CA|nr:uncharacterized protein SCHCODRAFT_02625539 [Schizophyllum commune H4-8]KAI5892197.1 hypothetical protein SCHCODRAFT_02625539 [Schizophyllum commune H4-8]